MAGVYLSFPFCAQKCTYCNFASGVFPRELEQEYGQVVHSEIEGHEWPWTPDTVYLGGGTPSRVDREVLKRWMGAIPGRPWREATMEAAPGDLTAEKIEAWKEAGINRVSLGVQSFQTKELAQTGRKHTAETVAADVDLLRSAGISNINLDLIAALPYQTPSSFGSSLEWIEKLAPPHVSVYMLEVDLESRLGIEILADGRRYGADKLPSEESIVAMYETAVERLGAMGIAQYEISNFAREGMESIHNLKYWRMEPYVGFGSDAHSFDGLVRRQNAEAPAEYVARFRRGESFCVEETPTATGEDRFLVGLRLTKGIALTEQEWKRFRAPIKRFVEHGLLQRDGDYLRLTRLGILFSNDVLQEFLS